MSKRHVALDYTILSLCISGFASVLPYAAVCFSTKVSSRGVRVKFTYCIASVLCCLKNG
jgi:hypothetical protein